MAALATEIPPALITRQFELTPADADARGRYRAVIAANDEIPSGPPIDLRNLDLEPYRRNPVVLYAHNRWADGLPVGRTTQLEWTARGLEAEFEFLPGDQFASRVRNAWKRGYLRAASISVRPVDAGRQEMVEWSILAVPADKDAVRSIETDLIERALNRPTGDEMDEAKVNEIVKTAVAAAIGSAQRGDNKTLDMDALTAKLSGVVKGEIASALKERDTAREAEAEAERKRAEAEKKGKTDRAQIEADAEARATTLADCRAAGLMPKDFDPKDKSRKDILVAAAGDEIDEASERSEDYLDAKIEDIIKRRSDATAGISRQPSGTGKGAAKRISRPMTAVDIQRLKRA